MLSFITTDAAISKEALQHIQGSPFDVDSAALALDGYLKDSYHHANHKQRPPQHSKQADHRLHPAQVKYFHPKIVDVREQLPDSGIKGFVQPLHQGIPDRVYDILTNIPKRTAQGISQTCQNIA